MAGLSYLRAFVINFVLLVPACPGWEIESKKATEVMAKPSWEQSMCKHRRTLFGQSLVFFSILCWLVSCAANPVTGRHELMLLSENDEARLGKKTDAQIAETYGLYRDPDLGAYIDTLGSGIAKHSHRSHLSFDFKVLDSSTVNAFAVPGGYVYVTRGILS